MEIDTDSLVEPTTFEVPRRVNPYSVINIMPSQEGKSLPPDPDAKEENVRLLVPSRHVVSILGAVSCPVNCCSSCQPIAALAPPILCQGQGR